MNGTSLPAYIQDDESNLSEVTTKAISVTLNGGLLSGALPLQIHRIYLDQPVEAEYKRSVDLKQYEMSDHLGNVTVVVGDLRNATISGTTVTNTAKVIAYSNYYPFGMQMPGRTIHSSAYRYGFNGMEKDEEVKGTGNSYDFGARIYDPRIGRFFSMDPQFSKFLDISPYNGLGNNPLIYIDPTGEILTLGGNLSLSFKDLQSILPEKYQNKIKINKDGTVRLKMSNRKIHKINDPGLSILNNLIRSKKSYLYEASNIGTAVNHHDNAEYTIDLNAPENKDLGGLINASVTPTNIVELVDLEQSTIRKKVYKKVPLGSKPKDGYDGQVTISETGEWRESNPQKEIKPRSSIVLHELLEVYNKTEFGEHYEDAHQHAIDIQNTLKNGDARKDQTPGCISPYGRKP